MTLRMLDLPLIKHVPDMVRMGTINKMQRQDKKRAKRGETTTNKDELKAMAQEEESRVLKLEAEMRAPGETPLPRYEQGNQILFCDLMFLWRSGLNFEGTWPVGLEHNCQL